MADGRDVPHNVEAVTKQFWILFISPLTLPLVVIRYIRGTEFTLRNGRKRQQTWNVFLHTLLFQKQQPAFQQQRYGMKCKSFWM